jgi:hypothetical protein
MFIGQVLFKYIEWQTSPSNVQEKGKHHIDKMEFAPHGTLSNHYSIIKLTKGPPDPDKFLLGLRKIGKSIYT